MRTTCVWMVLCLPLVCFGQYIGHPGGKAAPRGALLARQRSAYGYAGLDAGYTDVDVKGRYQTTLGVLREISRLEQVHVALSGGCNVYGLEVEGRLGGVRAEISGDTIWPDPFEDSWGLLVGGGLRYGFSPVPPLRLGLGGDFNYTLAYGDGYVSDGASTWREDLELELWQGRLFTGLGVDLDAGPRVVFSPYVGMGLEFLHGEVSIDEWRCCRYRREKLADLREKRAGFIYGGLDMHVGRHSRIGAEVRRNSAGWQAHLSLGVRF